LSELVSRTFFGLQLAAFLRDHGYAIDQNWVPETTDFISRLYAIEDYIVIAHDLADLERLLVDHVSTFLVGLGDECEVESADSGYGYDWDHGLYPGCPRPRARG
jgi:hypothetical protein